MQEILTLEQVSFAQKTPKINERSKKYNESHMIIPVKDMEWALEQSSPVYKLWSECWRSDPYGSRWMPLKTTLGRESLKKAKRPLIEAGLFLFENRLTVVDGKRIYEWWVKNLHGSRSSYWTFKNEPGIESTDMGIENTTQKFEGGIESTHPGIESTHRGIESTHPGIENTHPGTVSTTQPYQNLLAERVSKALSNVSVTLHKHFSISLTISQREGFLEFCLQKIAALQTTGFEVHTDHGWIASHYEQYWKEFEIAETTKGGARRAKKTLAMQKDWKAHPQYHDWLYRAYWEGYAWIQAEEAEREQRNEFYLWCHATDAFAVFEEKS